MLAALLLSATLLDAVEEIGPKKLPPGAAEEIRMVAAAQGIEIRAVEASEAVGMIRMEMTLAYGPPVRRGTGVCRGAVYLAEANQGGGPAKWSLVSLDREDLRVSYAVTGPKCDSRLASKVLVVTGTTPLPDGDLLGILEAVRTRRIAPDASSPVEIGDELTIEAVMVEPEAGEVVVLMKGGDPHEQLNVNLVKRGNGWFLSAVERPQG